MKTDKRVYLLFFILILLLSVLIGNSLAKYSKKIEVDEIELDVIAPEYWEDVTGSGFADGTFSIKTNTERTLVFEAMGKSRSK